MTKTSNLKSVLLALSMFVLGALGIVGGSLTTYVDNAQAAEPRPLTASETKDWASLADGAGAAEDVTVATAALGDACDATMSVDVVDMILTCNVTAANVATAHMQNETTGAVDLASGTLRITVRRKPAF